MRVFSFNYCHLNNFSHSRYHVEQTEKYSHLKPGVISDELRDALGLRSRDVPDFIYQMRIYGYPPGWIEEMKEENDGINIIDRVGLTSPTVPKMKFDLEKIIDFPGFNVPLESKYRDVSFRFADDFSWIFTIFNCFLRTGNF